MLKYHIVLAAAMLLVLNLFGQNTMTKAEDSDPEATKLLDKLKTKYEALSSMELDVSLILDLPEQAPEVQKGKLIRQGNQYKFDMADNAAYFDGETLWLHLKSMNEVQIMDGDFDTSGIPSPDDILAIYEQGEFVYAITQQFSKAGRRIKKIEFKPLSDNYDYAKLRVSIDIDKTELLMVEAFGKGDGSKYTLSVDRFVANKSYAASTFQFNPLDYPDIYVEDLR